MKQIHTASNEDLRDGLDMTEQLYQVCRKKHETEDAEYWSGIHTEISEELKRRGIDPYPAREVPPGYGKKYSW